MSTPQPTNHAKAQRYAYAQGKYLRAMGTGFYLEAITICESLISDRLLASRERRFGEKRVESSKRIVIRRLVEEHKGLAPEQKVASANGHSTTDLIADLENWIDERNELLHGIAKCLPGEELASPADLERRAREAAEQGQILFRQVDGWVRRFKGEDPQHRKAS